MISVTFIAFSFQSKTQVIRDHKSCGENFTYQAVMILSLSFDEVNIATPKKTFKIGCFIRNSKKVIK